MIFNRHYRFSNWEMESYSQYTIQSGLKREEYVYEWTIQNFDSVLLNDDLIKDQYVTVNCGNYGGKPLQWLVYLEAFEENGIRWMGIFYGLHDKDVIKNEKVFSRFRVEIMTKNNKYDRSLICEKEEIDDMKKEDWLGCYRFLDLSTVGKKGILTDGNLVLQINLELFRATEHNSEYLQLVETQNTRGAQGLSRDLLASFESAAFKDVVIITKDGAKFNVHKAILACRSPVFAAMFGPNFVEDKRGEVNVDDVSKQTMKVLLDYLYSGKISVDQLNPNELLDLAYAAEKYNVNLLRSLCDSGLAKKACLLWDLNSPGDTLGLVRGLRLQRAEKAITEFAKYSFQDTNANLSFGNANRKAAVENTSGLVAKIKTGVDKRVYKFQWIIQNFEVLIQNDEIITNQTKTIQFGQQTKVPLKWTFYMKVHPEDDGEWASLFYNLEKTETNEPVYCRLKVKIMRTKKATFRKLISEVADMTKKSNVGWEKFINLTDIGNTATFVNGSLILQVKLEVFTDIQTHFECLRLDKDLERLALRRLSKNMEKLYKNQDFSDVKIIMQDGVECKAHEVILAGTSTVFAAMLANQQTEEEDGIRIISVDNVNGVTMTAVLHYIYTGRVSAEVGSSTDKIVELAFAAKTYSLEGLHNFCDNILSCITDLTDAAHLFVTAKKLGMSKTEKAIGNYIKQHWEEINSDSVMVIIGAAGKRQLNCDPSEIVKRMKSS